MGLWAYELMGLLQKREKNMKYAITVLVIGIISVLVQLYTPVVNIPAGSEQQDDPVERLRSEAFSAVSSNMEGVNKMNVDKDLPMGNAEDIEIGVTGSHTDAAGLAMIRRDRLAQAIETGKTPMANQMRIDFQLEPS